MDMRKIYLSFLFLILIGFLPLSSQTWSPPVRLTWSSLASVDPSIACGTGNIVHLVWMDRTPGNYELFYKRSTDSGLTWSVTQRITWMAGDTITPQIKADNVGNVYVVWSDITPGNVEIYFKKSSNNGASWTAVQRLTWNAGNSYSPKLGLEDNGNIHVVWYDDSLGNKEIFHKRSTNKGTSWSVLKRLTWNSGISIRPDITSGSSNKIFIVWQDDLSGRNQIYFKKSADSGSNWSAVSRLTWTSPDYTYAPKITTDTNGNLHLTWLKGWHDEGWFVARSYGYYKYSINDGTTWSAPVYVMGDYTFNHEIVTDSNNAVHIISYKEPFWDWSYLEIYYKRSTTGGATWPPVTRMTYSDGQSAQPSIAVDGNKVIHVVWNRIMGTDPAEIYYKRGTQD